MQQPNDGPPLGQVAELAEGAQVAQERGDLVAVLEADDGVEQGLHIGRAPGVGHPARSSAFASVLVASATRTTMLTC